MSDSPPLATGQSVDRQQKPVEPLAIPSTSVRLSNEQDKQLEEEIKASARSGQPWQHGSFDFEKPHMPEELIMYGVQKLSARLFGP